MENKRILELIKETVRNTIREELQEMLNEAVRIASTPENIENNPRETKKTRTGNSIIEAIASQTDLSDMKNFMDTGYGEENRTVQSPPNMQKGVTEQQLPFLKKAGAIYKASKAKKKGGHKYLD